MKKYFHTWSLSSGFTEPLRAESVDVPVARQTKLFVWRNVLGCVSGRALFCVVTVELVSAKGGSFVIGRQVVSLIIS